ncbi:MAG: RluA family pseudouridine synthase [Candidatus Magasanikbacteria bacterium]
MKNPKNSQIFNITEEGRVERLDVFLSKVIGISRSQVQKMINAGLVLLDNKIPKKTGEKLISAKTIEVLSEKLLVEGDANSVTTKALSKKKLAKLEVLAETDDYLVINKPAGILVHPTQAMEKNTLVASLLAKYPEIAKVGDSERRPGIVHRLDKEASGLLVIARNQNSFEKIKKQFKQRKVEKIYSVLVYGNLVKDYGIIDFDIDRGENGRMVSRPKIDKMKLKNVNKIQEGKNALTEYWVEKRYKRFSLLKIKIHTGRTHQIRVHMFALGHPVVGDKLYVNKKLVKKGDQVLDRLFLHAKHLEFTDLQKNRVSFEKNIPKNLKDYLDSLV